MKAIVARMLGLILLVTLTCAPFAYAICRTLWQQGIYYTGCGANVEYAGEYFYACEPIDDYQNDQQDGNWLVVYHGECFLIYGNCVQEGAYAVTYSKKCGGTFVSATESDFNNGNCQCP